MRMFDATCLTVLHLNVKIMFRQLNHNENYILFPTDRTTFDLVLMSVSIYYSCIALHYHQFGSSIQKYSIINIYVFNHIMRI